MAAGMATREIKTRRVELFPFAHKIKEEFPCEEFYPFFNFNISRFTPFLSVIYGWDMT